MKDIITEKTRDLFAVLLTSLMPYHTELRCRLEETNFASELTSGTSRLIHSSTDRQRVNRFLSGIDCHDRKQVNRAIVLFQEAIWSTEPHLEYLSNAALKALKQDGFVLIDGVTCDARAPTLQRGFGRLHVHA